MPHSASAANPSSGKAGAHSLALPGAELTPLTFDDLPQWRMDDHAAAFSAFLRTCTVVVNADPGLRHGTAPSPALQAACKSALQQPRAIDSAAARRFFEAWFVPHLVTPKEGAGFLTGYFEPEFAGSLVRDAHFSAPLLGRPADLVNLEEGKRPSGLDPSLRAARRRPDGKLEAYPDRAAIEDGALGARAQPLVYLDPVDAFMAHVQGSLRVRLATGEVRRFAYAGRNGHPYQSVARLVVTETGIEPAALTAPKLVAWLRANPETGRGLMRRNASYIFFREAQELDPRHGPLGAANVQLTPGRSVAIDRTLWSYGSPVWIEAQLPRPEDANRTMPWRRLMIAQDTGSAIVGPARADLFFGSGEAAGAAAGIVRHAPERFVLLLPRAGRDGPS